MTAMNPMSSLRDETRERVFSVLRDRVLTAIENDEDLRWDSLLSRVDAFVNIATQKTYRGWTNCLLLAFASMEFHGDNRFLTFNQMKKMSRGNGFLRRNSRLTPLFVPLTRDVTREDDEGNERTGSVLVGFKTAWVANVQQTNLVEIGIVPEEWMQPNRDPAPDSTVMDFVSAIPFKQTISMGSPFYNPRNDEIGMPNFQQFKTAFKHSESLLHELIHWTGAEDRLNRDLTGWNNIQDYSHEELVACLGSSFLLAHLGTELGEDEVTNACAYLKNWLTPLTNDIEMLVTAAAEASRAANYLIKRTKEERQHEAA